jgi:hypothetical protein
MVFVRWDFIANSVNRRVEGATDRGNRSVYSELGNEFPKFYYLHQNTENDFKSNKTTGYFAPVAERTVAGSLLASAVEPTMLPEVPYSH